MKKIATILFFTLARQVLLAQCPTPVITTNGTTALCAGNSVTLYAPAGNTWTKLGDFAGSGRNDGFSFSIGNTGYIGAGYTPTVPSSASYLKDFWAYDPTTDTWTQKADFGGLGRSDGGGFSIGNKGYAGMGGSNTGIYSDFWEYDPAANAWTKKANFGGGTMGYDAVYLNIGSKGYVCNGASSAQFWAYDPATNTWTRKADFGGGARSDAAGFSIGGKGYIGTGYSSGNKTKDIWVYDTATNVWTQKADFGGAARGGGIGLSIGNKGYIGLGSGPSTYYYNSSIDDFWEYDPAADTWVRKADFGGGANTFKPVVFSIGNRGYIATGHSNITNTYTKDLWAYDPSIHGQSFIWSPGGQTTPSITVTTADNYSVALTDSTGCTASSLPKVVSVSPVTLAINNDSVIAKIGILAVDSGTGATPFMNTSCRAIMVATPDISNYFTGYYTSRAWVDAAQGSYGGNSYVKRHYEIYATNGVPSTLAMATLTLYATQQEFNDFNATSVAQLPTGPSDAAGIARLRIFKFNGRSSDGSGTFGSYYQVGVTGTAIDPADTSIVWNATMQRWEMTVPVTGFPEGLFIVPVGAAILPLTLLDFTAKGTTNGNVQLAWHTTNEVNTASFILQRGTDAVNFKKVVQMPATGGPAYGYSDEGLANGLYYYRLQMVDKDGSATYGPVVAVQLNGNTFGLYPVPAKDMVWLNGSGAGPIGSLAQLMDMQGRTLQLVRVAEWPQPINISALAPGSYLIKLEGSKTLRFIKL